MDGSSSQPQSSQPHNTGYWQEPNPHKSSVEQAPQKKKATRNRQKRLTQTGDTPRQTAWTNEKEIALAKGWRFVSENNERGNARKKDGFWVEVMDYIESKTKMEGRRTYDMAMIHYQAETGLPFKFRHCWDVLKDSPKLQEIAFPNFNQGSEGSSKRHKSSGSSSFNTESGEEQEIRRPGGRDKARAAVKNKGSKASGSSTMNDDALARLVVNEMTVVEVEQHESFIDLKRRDVECREREIAASEYRAQQEDMKLYLQPYDHLTGDQRLAWDEIRTKIKAKYNLQF
ncbi:glutathione S-transferase T3-like protein [Tanacetum coccineum]|uniref:Glutathione S-transferase T3-like protein n=1 Tax=Tanacetum coccineum TaxID=301880 RepID=A0ABQ4XZG3_9ASTR